MSKATNRCPNIVWIGVERNPNRNEPGTGGMLGLVIRYAEK